MAVSPKIYLSKGLRFLKADKYLKLMSVNPLGGRVWTMGVTTTPDNEYKGGTISN